MCVTWKLIVSAAQHESPQKGWGRDKSRHWQAKKRTRQPHRDQLNIPSAHLEGWSPFTGIFSEPAPTEVLVLIELLFHCPAVGFLN